MNRLSIDNCNLIQLDYNNFVCNVDGSFEEYIFTINDVPKYLICLYQRGELWSDTEEYGTIVIDISEFNNSDFEANEWCFYPANIKNEIYSTYIQNNLWEKQNLYVNIDKNKFVNLCNKFGLISVTD